MFTLVVDIDEALKALDYYGVYVRNYSSFIRMINFDEADRFIFRIDTTRLRKLNLRFNFLLDGGDIIHSDFFSFEIDHRRLFQSFNTVLAITKIE